MLPRLVLLGCPGSGTSASFSLRDLFPEWLRHEGKSCPREKDAENPRVVGLLAWAIRCANTGTAYGRKAGWLRRPGTASPPRHGFAARQVGFVAHCAALSREGWFRSLVAGTWWGTVGFASLVFVGVVALG
ncbi:hypothetical protein GCM10027271_06380 [Saccharopolyspora gloriosae]